MTSPKCEICFKNVSHLCKRTHPRVRFCSPECRKHSWYRRKNPVPVITDNECVICSKQFTPDLYHPNSKTCSKPCLRKKDYKDNKARYILKALEWGRNNRDKTKVTQKKYYWANLDKVRLQARARATGHISLNKWQIMCLENDNKCNHCGMKGDYKSLSIDHINPVSLGGGNEIGNLQPLCLKCNQKKGNRFVG